MSWGFGTLYVLIWQTLPVGLFAFCTPLDSALEFVVNFWLFQQNILALERPNVTVALKAALIQKCEKQIATNCAGCTEMKNSISRRYTEQFTIPNMGEMFMCSRLVIIIINIILIVISTEFIENLCSFICRVLANLVQWSVSKGILITGIICNQLIFSCKHPSLMSRCICDPSWEHIFNGKAWPPCPLKCAHTAYFLMLTHCWRNSRDLTLKLPERMVQPTA